uniref:TF-B3 domain-containing protein n=1 Tax=Solanum lycopersicum TaxID=4081 RepID=A0A3Q7FRJ2_SOLLC
MLVYLDQNVRNIVLHLTVSLTSQTSSSPNRVPLKQEMPMMSLFFKSKANEYVFILQMSLNSYEELPESWRKYLPQKAKLGRMIIYLRGQDKRIWPTLYNSRSGFNVLTCGWKQLQEEMPVPHKLFLNHI